VAAAGPDEPALRTHFARALPEAWEAVAADSFERVRFVQQHNPCDVLVVDETLYQREGAAGLQWLEKQGDTPVLLLSEPHPETVTAACRQAMCLWLPRQVALAHAPLLEAGLNRALQVNTIRRFAHTVANDLQVCRRQVDRLLGMLWQAAPGEGTEHWFTQRHMLVRLEEELAHCERHQAPLTVALGEVEAPAEAASASPAALPAWTTERIARAKRRCDVAGQYGLRGFLLLLIHTSQTGALTCCRRLQEEIEQGPPEGGGPHGPVRAYFGLATVSPQTATPQSLLSRAEQHLEAARAGAQNRLVAD
jgi:GGDEF domain-containing protein